MQEFDPLAYVTAIAPAVGIDLSPERARQVADAFAVVMWVAGPALAMDVPADIEPAPVFTA
jgi:hypothetical protein